MGVQSDASLSRFAEHDDVAGAVVVGLLHQPGESEGSVHQRVLRSTSLNANPTG